MKRYTHSNTRARLVEGAPITARSVTPDERRLARLSIAVTCSLGLPNDPDAEIILRLPSARRPMRGDLTFQPFATLQLA
jgi:hypothetical protein